VPWGQVERVLVRHKKKGIQERIRSSGQCPFLSSGKGSNRDVARYDQDRPPYICREVKTKHMGWIQTYTGRVFEPMSPMAEQVDLVDIAHALALTCRFNGHCTRFYSVAEHSVWVSRHVPAHFAKWGLLHDAAEAYVSDVARPIKPFIKGFDEIESSIMQIVQEKFGLEGVMPGPVHEADLRMLATEREQLMTPCKRKWTELTGFKPYDFDLACWGPEEAEDAFLACYEELR
jgi:uncharacterized protein